MTEILHSEGVDTRNQESLDRNNASVMDTIRTVKKLDRLFTSITKGD